MRKSGRLGWCVEMYPNAARTSEVMRALNIMGDVRAVLPHPRALITTPREADVSRSRDSVSRTYASCDPPLSPCRITTIGDEEECEGEDAKSSEIVPLSSSCSR